MQQEVIGIVLAVITTGLLFVWLGFHSGVAAGSKVARSNTVASLQALWEARLIGKEQIAAYVEAVLDSERAQAEQDRASALSMITHARIAAKDGIAPLASIQSEDSAG